MCILIADHLLQFDCYDFFDIVPECFGTERVKDYVYFFFHLKNEYYVFFFINLIFVCIIETQVFHVRHRAIRKNVFE